MKQAKPSSEDLIIKCIWQEPWDDRRQELVVIGVGLNRLALIQKLDECLLANIEMSEGPKAWVRYDDGSPPWPGCAQDADAA